MRGLEQEGLAVLLLAERLPDRVQAHAVGWGLVICLFGMTLGVLMFDPINEWVQQRVGGPPTVLGGAHTVGAPDGGPGIPLTHWSATAGDLRVPHFVGLHGLQLLPLTGWILATRGRRLGLARQLAVVRLVGVGYLGLVTLLLWQALRGQSIVHTDRLTLLGAAALVTGTATAILAVSRQHGSAGPRPDIRRLADPGRQVAASRNAALSTQDGERPD